MVGEGLLGRPNTCEGVGMAARTEDLRLLVDPSFRCTVALAHGVRSLLLELHLADGRRVPVSHDPAFRPVLTPCHLRLAMAQAAVGAAPDWLGAVVGWSAGGPFVEPVGPGVVARGAGEGRTASFATTLSPIVVRELGQAVDTGGDDLHVRVQADAAVGSSVVEVSAGPDVAPALVDLGAVLLAGSCRDREHVLRTAPRA